MRFGSTEGVQLKKRSTVLVIVAPSLLYTLEIFKCFLKLGQDLMEMFDGK